MNRDVTITLTGRGEFSMKRVEYDADCVVVHAFSEFTDENGNAAVDINTEIAGSMDASDLVESMASATGAALWGIAQQLNRRPDDVYGAFIFHMTQLIQKNKERQATE